MPANSRLYREDVITKTRHSGKSAADLDKFYKEHGLDKDDWIIYWKFYWLAEKARKASGNPYFTGHQELFDWWVQYLATPEQKAEFEEMQSRVLSRLSQTGKDLKNGKK